MSIYIKIPNTEGDVTTEGYKGWIEAFDVGFAGITNPTNMAVGQKMGRTHTFPTFSQIVIRKHMDSSSVYLFESAHNGMVYPEIEIHYVTTGSKVFTYAKTKLTNASVSQYTERCRGAQEMPEELIRLAYTKIERTFIPRDKANQTGSQIVSGFDLVTAQRT